MATSGLSSVFTLTTLTRPLNSAAISSRTGLRTLHGPHQGAQKSTSVGSLESTTSLLNVASVAATTRSLIATTSLTQVDTRRARTARRLFDSARAGGPARGQCGAQ